MKERRVQLRNNATDAEKMLWQRLKKSQMGFKFIRQYSIANFIVDFYCPKKKLAIELDGGQHKSEDSREYDKYRTEYMMAGGIKVIRFWNKDVENEIEKVVEKIMVEIV